MKSFELLDVRKQDDPIDIDRLEQRYDLEIPPFLACFIQCFKIDRLRKKVVYVPDDDVCFDDFIGPIEFMLESSKSLIFDDVYLEKGLIPFASSEIHSGGICIGTLGKEKDQVLLDTDFPDRFRPICSNVFLFVSGLEHR